MKRLARGVALTRTYPPQALCALDPRPLAFGALGGAAGELRLLVRRQDQRARLCPQPESWTETHRRKHLTQGEERVLGQEVPPPPGPCAHRGRLCSVWGGAGSTAPFLVSLSTPQTWGKPAARRTGRTMVGK